MTELRAHRLQSILDVLVIASLFKLCNKIDNVINGVLLRNYSMILLLLKGIEFGTLVQSFDFQREKSVEMHNSLHIHSVLESYTPISIKFKVCTHSHCE